MDYIESNLRKDETVIIRAKISWLTLIGSIIWMVIGLVLALVVPGTLQPDENTGVIEEVAMEASSEIFGNFGWYIFGLATLAFVLRVVSNMTTHLAVTNKRVIGKVGVLAIYTIDYPIEKLDSVSYNAGLLGRIFKYATVQIASVGGDKKGVRIKGIGNAQEFKNKVNDAIESHAAEAREEQARAIAAAMGR